MSEYLAQLPSPGWSGFSIGPLTISAGVLCVLLGIVVALWMTNRRWQAMGGHEDDLWNISIVAVLAGIIGGRVLHVLSQPESYFGPDGDPMSVIYIWNGGQNIWGAIAFGMLAAWAVAKFHGIKILPFLDAAAPGLIVAQAIGRWGNWFNQELFGSPTSLPWGLHIDKVRDDVLNSNWPDPALPADTLFHPTFLYESIWNFAGCIILIVVARKLRLGHGQVFALYLCYYAVGRVWIETLRVDDASMVLGLRLNIWISILALIIGLIWFLVSRSKYKGPESDVYDSGARALSKHGGGKHRADRIERARFHSHGGSGSHTDHESPRRNARHRGGTAETTGSGGSSGRSRGSGSRRSPEANEKPSFGFFGAVTSAISIVPDVGQGTSNSAPGRQGGRVNPTPMAPRSTDHDPSQTGEDGTTRSDS